MIFTVFCLILSAFCTVVELSRVMDKKVERELRRSRIKWVFINASCFALNLWVLSTQV